MYKTKLCGLTYLLSKFVSYLLILNFDVQKILFRELKTINIITKTSLGHVDIYECIEAL